MTQHKTRCALLIVALLFSLLAAGCGGSQQPAPAPTAEPAGITHFMNLAAADLDLSDDLTVDGLVIFGSTDLTVTDGATLTPESSFYHLDSAGAVTMTIAACANNGQLLILYGDDANTITVNDTNVRTTTGSTLDIGQYDVAVWVCADTEWVEISLAADS